MSSNPPRTHTTLIAGVGDLGTEVGLRLAAAGDRVVGLRRRVEALPPAIEGISVDLRTSRPVLPPADWTRLAVVLTADGRDAQAYRETYVDGLRRVLDAVAATGPLPERVVLVSSTGVYGDLTGDIDEDTPPAPARATHEILLEAEDLLHERAPHGTVLRLSGLYGPGRGAFITRAREGAVQDRWTNRIHRDDAAAAVVHLLTMPTRPARLYLGTDTEPAPARDVADLVRRESGLPPLPRDGETPHGRRLSSARLRATGFTFTHPTYRQGYAAVLAGRGRRHP